MQFIFNEFKTGVFIDREIPSIEKIAAGLNFSGEISSLNPLFVCDENTLPIAERIRGKENLPVCVLKSGEENKNWQAVQEILKVAHNAGLGRDGIFIAVGGGVIGDLCGFASSIYMRGCRFVLVSTTLLGMVDASVGGKTGFDLFGIKNLVGTFYPAQNVYMPLESLATLPEREWKSGMAELIKTAILDGDDFLDKTAETAVICKSGFCAAKLHETENLRECIEKAVLYKGGVVSEDLRESGKRMLLNLGHTFAHALEAASGLGKLSHGEAVAWGIVRSCELGLALRITPQERAKKITEIIKTFGYYCESPHPLANSAEELLNAMKSDKKKKQGKLTFIVPNENSAQSVSICGEDEIKTVKNILAGNI